MTTKTAVEILEQAINSLDDAEQSEVASMALQVLQEKAERYDNLEY